MFVWRIREERARTYLLEVLEGSCRLKSNGADFLRTYLPGLVPMDLP